MGGLVLLAGIAVEGCGIAVILRRRHPQAGLLFVAAGLVIGLPSNIITGQWPLVAGRAAVTVWILWLLWRRRRRKRAPRMYGAKSRALIAALTRRAREAARPRPVRRPAPQGA